MQRDGISGFENGEQKRKSVCAPRGNQIHHDVTKRKLRRTAQFTRKINFVWRELCEKSKKMLTI